MTKSYTSDGWRDDRLDALQNLGRNAHNFTALNAHIARERRKSRVLMIGAGALVLAVWGVAWGLETMWTEWNRVAVEVADDSSCPYRGCSPDTRRRKSRSCRQRLLRNGSPVRA